MMSPVRIFALSVVMVAVVGEARADGFLHSGSGARSVATGGAYLPGSRSALDAMAINPAGLALLNGPAVELSLGAHFAAGTFVNRTNSDGRLSASGLVPYGAWGRPIGRSRYSVAVAVLPELLSSAKWDYTDTPGGVGNVSYGRLQQQSSITAFRFAGGLGIYLGRKVQVGATLGTVLNTNRLQTAYVFQEHPALAGLKTELDLQTSGTGIAASIGVIVQPTSRFRIGAAYKTQTKVESRGSATGNAGVQFAAIGLG
ncbi:MAG: outer membrane protein transport protein, partial [Bryobacteraceae bacterium]|nr:outer membrane protein transport protein [Bryobacteraceae bacterium]